MSSLLGALGAAFILQACGDNRPIAEETVAAPVVETRPGVGAIYGNWATEAGSCVGAATERITIGEGRLDGRGHACTMTQPQENGGGWLVTLDCQSSDGTRSERVRLTPQEQKLVLTYIDRTQSNDARFERCS